MRKQLSGQITLEAALVTPVVMMIIVSAISLTFYVHDVVAIKSAVYEQAVISSEKDFEELKKDIHKKVKETPLWSVNAKVDCTKKLRKYEFDISLTMEKRAGFLQTMLPLNKQNYIVSVEKNINKEMLYGIRAVMDFLGD